MDKFLLNSNAKPSTSHATHKRSSSSMVQDEEKVEAPLPPNKKSKTTRDFNDKWLVDITFKNWISKREQASGSVTAFCKVCNCSIMNHKPALVKHMKTSKHIQNITSVSHTTPIEVILKPKKEDELKKRAELKITAFLAQHNLPLSLSDDLIPFLANTFPDSEIIKSLNLGRTKATNTVKHVLGPIITHELVEKLKKKPFSVIMDETTDISVKKQCALTVIYEDEDEVRTQFLDIYEAKSGKAEDLTSALLKWINDKGIPLNNFVGFASDTTNSMVGQHNSVFSHLKDKIPHITCVKCSCHMMHLVASKACLKLPRSVEDLLRSVGAHFSRSPARQEKLKEFQNFFQTDIHQILNPSVTRWLSLKACVDRTLEQYEVLTEYFTVEVFEDPSRITEDILSTLNNKFTKIYLEFMSYVLGLFTDFNLLFQSQKPLLHEVRPEIYRLIKTITSNYMVINHCKATEAYEIEYSNPRFFSNLENIYLGVAAQESLNELKKELVVPAAQIQEFRKTCLCFYIEAIKQVKQRFNFSDPIYNLIEITDPTKAQSYENKDLSNIIDRFPNLKDEITIEELNKEWKKHAFLDFQQLNISTDQVEEYWKKIFKMKNSIGVLIFPNLKKVMMLLLSLPFSNASVERIFSQLKLIKCDNRNRLGTDTIAALMATKAFIKNATTFEPTKAMLQKPIKYNKAGKECEDRV